VKRIMQDRCKFDIREYLGFEYGEREGVYNQEEKQGILSKISKGMRELPAMSQSNMQTEWQKLKELWDNKEEYATSLERWFESHTLLQAVKSDCMKSSKPFQNLLDEQFDTKQAEFSAMLELKKRQDVEKLLDEARRKLDQQAWMNFWERWKNYILLASVFGVLVLCLLMRVWRQINATCRVCTACCGDWGDSSTTTKVVVTQQGGGSPTRVHHAALEGPRVPFASAVAVQAGGMSSSSASQEEKVSALERNIKDLQRRVNTQELN